MRRRGLLAGVALGLLLAGCGVPIQAHPQAIPRNKIPYGLLAGPHHGSRRLAAGAERTAASVYLVENGRLDEVARLLRSPLGLPEALTALLDGPTRAEAAAGIHSALGSHTSLQGAATRGDTAYVDLGDAFARITGHQRLLAVAQLVYTSTAVPGVQDVALSIDGQPAEVPLPGGTVVGALLTRADFSSVAPDG